MEVRGDFDKSSCNSGVWFRLLTKVKGNTRGKVAEAVSRQFDQEEELRNGVVCEENLENKGELSFF